MRYLGRALSAEMLKTKRTLTLTLAFLAPLALAFLELAISFQYGKRVYGPGGDAWMTLIGHTAVLWVLLMLPLFITLEMGLLGAIEHNNKTWKQLYALPLPRWSVYAAKQIVGMGVIALSMAMLAALIVGVGLIGRHFLPESGYDAPIPWGALGQYMTLSFLAAWLIISIHLWISLRSSSFALAMAAGICATVFGVVVFDTRWEQLDPWTIPGVVLTGLSNARPFGLPLAIGLLGGVVAAMIGAWEATRHDIL